MPAPVGGGEAVAEIMPKTMAEAVTKAVTKAVVEVIEPLHDDDRWRQAK
jgi:hypothetical protein